MAQKILVVDDDVVTLHFVEKVLSADGYEVIKTDDGLDALNFIKKGMSIPTGHPLRHGEVLFV